MVKRMKSDQVRVGWKDVLQHTRMGNAVIVEHYNDPIAALIPYSEATFAVAREALTQAQEAKLFEMDRGDLQSLAVRLEFALETVLRPFEDQVVPIPDEEQDA